MSICIRFDVQRTNHQGLVLDHRLDGVGEGEERDTTDNNCMVDSNLLSQLPCGRIWFLRKSGDAVTKVYL